MTYISLILFVCFFIHQEMALAKGICAPLGTCSSFRRWDIRGVEKGRMGIGGGGRGAAAE